MNYDAYGQLPCNDIITAKNRTNDIAFLCATTGGVCDIDTGGGEVIIIFNMEDDSAVICDGSATDFLETQFCWTQHMWSFMCPI